MSWRMYAQRRLKREQTLIGGNVFYAFGSLGRAHQGAGDGVSEVELTIDGSGTYWGWLPRGGERPLYVSSSEEELAVAYSCGDRTRDIQDSQRRGCGKILRLAVRELAEVTS